MHTVHDAFVAVSVHDPDTSHLEAPIVEITTTGPLSTVPAMVRATIRSVRQRLQPGKYPATLTIDSTDDPFTLQVL